MVGIIFHPLLPRLQQLPFLRRLSRGNVACLARSVAGRNQKDISLTPRLRGLHFEALVLLLIHHRVRFPRPRRVPVQPVLPLRNRVFLRIKNRLVIIGPNHRPNSLRVIGQCLPRPQILHRQRELPEPRVVIRIRQQIPIRTHRKRRHRHELLPLGQFIHIQQHFLRRVHAAFFAAPDRILFPRLRPHIIKVVSLAIRHLNVRLLDPPQHLVIQLLLKPFSRFHHRFSVSILRLQISPHLRIRLVPQPEIVVHHLVPVDLRHMRNHLRYRRLRQSPCVRSRQHQHRPEHQPANLYPPHRSRIHASPKSVNKKMS